MDYILGNAAHGSVARRLMAANFDPNVLRPFEHDGKSYINQKVRQADGSFKLQAIPVGNTEATLRKEDWIQLDTAIVKAAKERLAAVADLRRRGQVYTIPNGMGKTVLQTETQSDIDPAIISMDGLREAPDDRPHFDLLNLPLPIIHKDFQFSLRQIQTSRNGGSPLDTSTAELAARRVAESAEQLLLGTLSAYTYGGGTIYGYTNFPSRISATVTDPSTVAAADRGTTIVNQVLNMRQSAVDALHYGPYSLYFGIAWDQYLDADFKANSDITVRQRLAQISSISEVSTLDYLSGFQVLLVQNTSDVVREVVGMDVTTVQWETQGGMLQHFKVMAILVPQLRADFNGNTGIVHGNTA